jgi:hypothetical protein
VACVPRSTACTTGYGGAYCTDIDECIEESHGCDVDATCINTRGSFMCRCGPGFRGNSIGTDCTDVDECELHPHLCYRNETCTNTHGSFVCTLRPRQRPHLQYSATMVGVSKQQFDAGQDVFKAEIARGLQGVNASNINITRVVEITVLWPVARRLLQNATVNTTAVQVDYEIVGLDSGYVATVTADALQQQQDNVTAGLQNTSEFSALIVITNNLLTNVSLFDATNPCTENNCAPEAECTPTLNSFTCTCRAGFVDVSPPVSFPCESRTLANPRCWGRVHVEPWMRDPWLSVRVAETDFDLPEEYISAVFVDGVDVDMVNDLLVGGHDCFCHNTTLIVDDVPLTPGTDIMVEVRTTPAVTKMPCCCCGVSLRGEAIVHHRSGLACVFAPG